MAQNDQIFQFDNRSVLAALAEMNKAIQGVEKGGTTAVEKLEKAFTSLNTRVITSTNQAAKAQDRYVKSIEMTAAAYGRSGVDKLIAQRDQIIKRLGDEEKLVQRVTAAYARMIKIEQEKGSGSGSGGGLFGGPNSPASLALRSVRDISQGRIGYGVSTGASALAGLSGSVALIGGMTVALGALSIASFKAMGSLAELGVETHSAGLRLGMSAKQVGEFTFAAKAVGQDIDVFERGMRGLTQAVEDQSAAGDKARSWLIKFGVDIRGLRDGTASTADTFQRIAAGLSQIESPLERNKALLDVFKRVGIEIIPVFEHLQENLKKAQEYGFGLSTEEETKLLHYKDQLTVIDAIWERIWRHAKEHLAGLASGVIDAWGQGKPPSGYDLGTLSGRGAPPPRWSNLIGGAFDISGITGPGMPTAPGLTPTAAKALQDVTLGMGQYRADQYNQTGTLESRLKQAEELRAKLGEINQYSTAAEIASARADDAEIERWKEKIKLRNESLEVDKKIGKLAEDIAARVGHPYGLTRSQTELEGIVKSPGTTQAQFDQARQLLIPQAARDFQELLARQQQVAASQLTTHLQSIGLAGEEPKPRTNIQQLETLATEGGRSVKDLESSLRVLDRSRQYADATSLRQAESGATIAGILGPQTPQAKLATETQIAGIRLNASNQELAFQQKLLDTEYDGLTGIEDMRKEKEERLQEARLKNAEEVGKIQDQLAQQSAQEVRRQIDEIKAPTEKLFHTLFTTPQKFGKELGATLHEAAIKPAISMLSDTTARFLQPLIFGGEGGGGLASVKPINGSLPVYVTGGAGGGTATTGGALGIGMAAGTGTAVFGGAGGGGGFGYGGSGGGGGSTFSFPSISPLFIDGGGFAGSAGSLGPGGTSGFAGPLGGGGSGGGGGRSSGGFASLFGGDRSVFSKAGLSSLGKSIGIGAGLPKGTVGFGADGLPHDDYGNVLSGGTTSAASVFSSKGAQTAELTAGTAFLQAGLLGNRRGTGGGILESGIGGAGVGAAIGSMIPGVGTAIGAGIGAAAGTLAGLGEMLAGVESPRDKAKRLVQTDYHISISNSMADSIAQLAASKYGQNMSVAVRSPEVRQMLGLYAAGTGQANRFPLGADTPHGASLVSSGGQLMQQAQYQYGNAYAYQSSLPIYGGVAANPLSSPGGDGGNGGRFLNLSLNVDGAGVSNFMTGQVVTPSFVSSQYSASLNGSVGRTQQALDLSEPGSIVG